MAVAAFETGASLRTGRRIDSEFPASAMNIIRERLHVRKLLVRMDDPLCVAFTLPCVIDIDIHISGLSQAAAHHGIRLGAYDRVADLVREMIPTVPTHGRSARQGSGMREA